MKITNPVIYHHYFSLKNGVVLSFNNSSQLSCFMKKNKIFFILLIISTILIISQGCQKLMDFIQVHPTAELPICQIRQLNILPLYGNPPDTLKFKYNSWRDPVSILRAEPTTGSANYFFHYDNQHRLTETIGAYGQTPLESGVESWEKYFYDGNGRVIKDSLYFFPDIVDGQPVHGQYGVITVYLFEYDAEERISKVISYREKAAQPYIETYTYDAKGNLTGPATYDNKLNFRRTNKLWMFLDRNYSLNNTANASYSYNQLGLPTKIDYQPGDAGSFRICPATIMAFTNATIEYDCH